MEYLDKNRKPVDFILEHWKCIEDMIQGNLARTIYQGQSLGYEFDKTITDKWFGKILQAFRLIKG